MLTINEYPNHIALGRGGKYGTLVIEPERFPQHVHAYIYAYGVRQILNDAMADKKDDDGRELPTDQIVAKAEKRLANMYAGELRAQRESSEPADPVDAEAFKMAKSAMLDLFRELPEWKTIPKGTKDRFAAMVQIRREQRGLPEMSNADAVPDAIEKFLAAPANAHIRKAAERIVKEREKGAAIVATLADAGI